MHAFLDSLRGLPFHHTELGATYGLLAPDAPVVSGEEASLALLPEAQLHKRYNVDRYHAVLGKGEEAFLRGKQALEAWVMYPQPWTTIHCLGPQEPGQVFAAEASHFGFRSLNGCRILYSFTEEPDAQGVLRAGFGMGALQRHIECGEEVFCVAWDTKSQVVSYHILAFSRPAHPLVRLAYPLGRMMQKRFGKQSCQAMTAACLP